MIKFGFNTLAMLTFGLGIRMELIQMQIARRPRAIQFRDKPAGIAVEEKTAPTSFGDILTSYKEKKVEFEDEND